MEIQFWKDVMRFLRNEDKLSDEFSVVGSSITNGWYSSRESTLTNMPRI